MWLVNVCHAAAVRFLENLSLPLAKEKGDLPIEEDPVGEFLARKRAVGAEMEDEETLEAEATEASSEEPDWDTETVDAPDEAPATLVEKTFEQDRVEQIALPASGVEDSGAADRNARDEDVLQEDSAWEEVGPDSEPSVMSAERLNTDGSGSSGIADEPVSRGEVERGEPVREEATGEAAGQGEDEIAELLEVFKSEELIDNPLADLSRDMDDVSVYSLLEEIRSVAERVKKAP